MNKIWNHFIIRTILAFAIILAASTIADAKSTVATPDVETKYGKWMNLSTEALVTKGREFLYQKQCPDSALVCFSIVTSRYKESLSKEEKELIYKAAIGKWYAQFFHYYDSPKAYESLQDAFKISNETGKGRGMANLNLAMMYQMFGTDGRDNEALHHAKTFNRKAFQEALAENDTNVVHMAFSNMISLVSDKKEVGEIKPFRDDYVKFMKGSHHPITSFNILLYDINLAIASADYDKALSLLDQQEKYVTGFQPRYLISILMSRANIYRLQHDYLRAEQQLNEAEKIAAKENMKDVLLNIYDDKRQLFHDSGERGKQAEAYYSYLCMKDTLLNYRQISGFTEINFLSEMERLDQALTQIQYKRRVQTWITLLCIAIISCLVIAVLIVNRKNRKLRAANMSLYEKTREQISRNEQEDELEKQQSDSTNDSATDTETSEEEKARQAMMMKVIRKVAANSEEIYSPKFTISKFSELVEIPVKQLSKIINEESGENFNGFINRYRIKKACFMLDDVEKYGSLTIENIALEVGFRSRTAFIAAFKKMTGLNPSDYLKAARQARLNQKAEK